MAACAILWLIEIYRENKPETIFKQQVCCNSYKLAKQMSSNKYKLETSLHRLCHNLVYIIEVNTQDIFEIIELLI